MILVSKTYSETTPESAAEGEPSDAGFVFEDSPHTFRELVALMRDYSVSSCHPSRGETHEWFSNGGDVVDYSTLTEREESIHYSRANDPRSAKYWTLAAKVAGNA